MSDLDGDVPDTDLMSRLGEDPTAFEALFRRHRRAISDYAARRCTEPADVADLVASTFVAALDSASRYDAERGEVRAWLIGIAHNQLRLLFRREYHQRSLQVAVEIRRHLSEDAFARIEDRIDASREAVQVERAMAKLPARQQEVLWLVGYDDLTPLQAAGVLGVTPGAFRVRLSRARSALRAAMSDSVPLSHLPLIQEVK